MHTVNRYIAATVRPGFDIRPPFSFPDPKYIRPVEEVARMKWVHELADILAKKTNKIVYLTSVDEGYFVMLLNWLVAVDLNRIIRATKIVANTHLLFFQLLLHILYNQKNQNPFNSPH